MMNAEREVFQAVAFQKGDKLYFTVCKDYGK